MDDLLDLNLLKSNLHNLFDFLGHLDDLLNLSLDWNELLDDSVNWDWNLNWDSEWPIHLDDLLYFDDLWNDSLDLQFSGDFDFHFDDLLAFLLDDLDFFKDSFNWHNFFYNFFNDSVNFVVEVFDDFDFLDSFLDDWNLN